MSKQGRSGSPLTSVGSQKDDTAKIRQDVSIIAQRIHDLNETSGAINLNASSPFVAGLRGLADAERKGKDPKDLKIEALEALLEKIAEFDRIILQKTTIVDPTVAPVRRKSVGMDLYAIPTHLHITDRLLDLFAQSRRVTVIKTTGQVANVPLSENANDRKAMETLRAQTAKLSAQLSECDEQRQRHEAASAQLKKECDELRRTLQEAQSTGPQLVITSDFVSEESKNKITHLETSIAQSNREYEELGRKLAHTQSLFVNFVSEDSKSKLCNLEAEVKELTAQCEELRTKVSEQEKSVPQSDFVSEDTKLKVASLETTIAQLQERLEIEAGKFQSLVTVIYGKASRINSGVDVTVAVANNDCMNQPENVRNAFFALETAISRRVEGLRSEVHMLLSVKELLEGELSSVNLQRDMLHTDYNALSSEHEVLKTAYHELSLESASGANYKGGRGGGGESSLQSQLKEANDTIIQLQTDLYTANRKVADMDKLAVAVSELEQKLHRLGDEKVRLESTVSSQVDEIRQYLQLTETLKEKIKDLANKSGGGGKEAAAARDFLDTFEEVMREEMLTMKGAFESKLKAAKDAADATSKRHQQEIMRIHTQSPYSALKR